MIEFIFALVFAIAYILVIISLNEKLTKQIFFGVKVVFLLMNLISCITSLVESNLIVSSFSKFMTFLVLFLFVSQIVLFLYFEEGDNI